MLIALAIGGADDSRHSTQPDRGSLLTFRPRAPTVSTHPCGWSFDRQTSGAPRRSTLHCTAAGAPEPHQPYIWTSWPQGRRSQSLRTPSFIPTWWTETMRERAR
ncbi:hypothetical protein [Synechococcus sp. BIOS-U3-1]|uniref:hypothetical protein n=1 Tax=Synechococcus sp. BIOS-U3-1 TaxID=1400865 RepID=UPI001645646E|nr:hypothetical protein [Synechococcus sp. BIOS-U3-1]